MEVPPSVAPGSTPDATLNDEMVFERYGMLNLNGQVLEVPDESHRSTYVKNIDGLCLHSLQNVIVHYMTSQPQSDRVPLESHINYHV